MQQLNPWQDPARLTCQAYFPRVYDGRSSSSFVQVHRSAPLGYCPQRGIRSGGGSGRLCPDHSGVRTRCLLLLHHLMEIGHGIPREWPSTTAPSLSLGLPYLHRIFFLHLFPYFSPQLRKIELTNRWTPLWVPRLADIDGSLIMLANCARDSLEIRPQEPPRLQTVCSLELPALEPYAYVIVYTVDKHWVPTASRGGGRSLPARKRVVPFRSSKVGTIGLLIEHEMRTASARVRPSCWMTIGVPELLSVVASTSRDPAGGDCFA
jgi:hypothetical protein